MTTFAAMLFSMRLGLAPAPSLDVAAVSLQQEVHAVAMRVSERLAATAEVSSLDARRPSMEVAWSAPPRYALTREDWRRMIDKALSNETMANAAMWLATQPVRVSMNGKRFFVAVRFATP